MQMDQMNNQICKSPPMLFIRIVIQICKWVQEITIKVVIKSSICLLKQKTTEMNPTHWRMQISWKF